mmetsp:Transcript_54386/g.80692  ORF Transcript_54386/g.80692 Transcript_54386/m.80692 type:complete len:563 (-) Transcript_54386:33-1721(-)|eukprot:CAMPEP_0195523038 /NCGR_PEP_ID=MMETSP0794_2-20130614/21799_1 /TAXON_ID=515487 /ORGANISM="Stephanopyxis turris, Strain CCMP 815" /LENGTH=562 /DNA_ID=CAMNT_0040652939 /DNA_START=201 /DNA_END=1889 /DNA_ORIENTATION=+
MTDAKEEEDNSIVETTAVKPSPKKVTIASPPPIPPLDASARRLERLLGGGNNSKNSKSAPISMMKKEEQLIVTNPAKIVRRWLGASSGVTAKCSLSDLAACAGRLLDGDSCVGGGRGLLMDIAAAHCSASPEIKDEVMADASSEEKKGDDIAEPDYLLTAHRQVEAWLLCTAVRLLWKDGKFNEALTLSNQALGIVQSHLDSVTNAPANSVRGDDSLSAMSSPALFPLLARLFRFRSLAAESAMGRDAAAEGLRSDLVHRHRMACLRRDVDTQATLLNLMLRDLLHLNQVEQAQKILSNSTFPDNASNNQLCRHLYHSGRIQALRLEYTTSFSNLSQCLRKAPTNTGLGFRIAVQRLLVIVQLLMGEIPKRNSFFAPGMKVELAPYLQITQAVRRGDLRVFHDTVAKNQERLMEDGMYTLISRLAHSVVKAGLRKLNVSYSRISLADIAQRLSLPSASSAEFVVAKAIRDGVIDATIDHEGGFVKSHELVDVYATTEPMEAFHRRIAYCLTTHNEAVRGMRYPPDAYKKQLEASRGEKGGGDDDKTDEEKAAELEDEMDEEF